jgi:hypothetical protein
MVRLFGTLLVTWLALVVPFRTFAATKVKGKGRSSYRVFSITKTRRSAVDDAIRNAVRQFASNFDASRYKIFQDIEDKVLERLDEFVVDHTVLDTTRDRRTKTIHVVVEASIDEARIEALLRQNTPRASPNAEAPLITFVLIGREVSSTKTFDAKRTVINQKEAEENELIGNQNVSAGNRTTIRSERTEVNRTGGSTERKAEQVTHRVFSIGEADAALNEVFTKAGYELVDPRDAEIGLEAFREEFSRGDDISSATRKAAIAQCRDLEISFLAVGHLDVGVPKQDPVTGLTKVFVSVSAKVSDLRKRLPRTLASVRGVKYSGLGDNARVARQNALNRATRTAASDLVDQLRAKGVMQ